MASRTTYRALKRAFDLIAAMIGMIMGAPLIAVASIAIRFESKGSPIFAQRRVGTSGRTFTCYKLRTMYAGTAHLPTHHMQECAVTPLGMYLRRWKLDELPQLYNVLVGEMSLVGPRPCLPSQTRLIKAREQMGVHCVLPGITGLAQVRGIDMSDPGRLAAVDAEYAKNANFLGDLRLVIATLLGLGLGIDNIRQPNPRNAVDPK
jgi:O-antigen biosynthesis protein WbqP